MQFKAENEKVFTMNVPYTSPPDRSSITADPQIQRSRKNLLIILGVCLALSVVSLISGVFEYQPKTEEVNTRRSTQVGQALISILLYGFGLFAAYRCWSLSLRIFGILIIIGSVVLGILLGLILILALMTMVASEYLTGNQSKDSIVIGPTAMIFTAIILAVNLIFSIIIAKLAFQLARLIDA